ncbi:MAG: hypothetical protein HZC28_15750 [Spirochaetes bacterium]|nr:hypothetical protein [Spirochaetota bacterium]
MHRRMFSGIAAAVCCLIAACSYLPVYEPSLYPDVMIRENRSIITLVKTNVPVNPVGFMFYPGGFVDPHGYITPLSRIADAGIPVMVVKVPGNLAVFSPDAGIAFTNSINGVIRWVIGGHSLGGVMAAESVKAHPDVYAGIIFMASYTADGTDLSRWPHPVLSLSAEFDGLSTPAKISNSLVRLPLPQSWIDGTNRTYPVTNAAYTMLHRIAGGNHAQFGAYGKQDGDGTATLSADGQHAAMADYVNEFFVKNGWH